MNRVERFREIRRFRRKLVITFLLFIITLTVGITVADYSMSGLMNKDKGLRVVCFEPFRGDYYKIGLFNNNVYINTKYITSDYKRLVDWIKGMAGMFEGE